MTPIGKSLEVPSYINLCEKKTRMYLWENGTALIDIVAGLPEFLTLSKLDKNELHSIGYLTIINHLPPFPQNGTFYSYYDILKRIPTTSFQEMNGFSVGFINALHIAQKVRPMKLVEALLAASVSNISLKTDDNTLIHAFFPLWNVFEYCEAHNISVKSNESEDFRAEVIERNFRMTDGFISAGFAPAFKFEASLLRTKAVGSIDAVKTIISEGLKGWARGRGFSGLVRTSTGGYGADDVQHSNFFGDWMNTAAWIAAGRADLLRTAVFNERGHLLDSKQGSPDEDDS
jgi:hypothetical protein